jgi:succinate-semialdehyde dehydrogenase/glutarate-semialdehyde dehydrogenase
MQDRILIDGEWQLASDGSTVPVCDPATDEVLAQVPVGKAEDVRAAIDSSARALLAWRELSAGERGRPVGRFAQLVDEQSGELAGLISREGGKPLPEARGEVAYGQSFLAWAAGEAVRVYGELVPSWDPAKRILVQRPPIGVTAAITPWNFPLAMITRKVGPALAAGCTQVVKRNRRQ